MAIDRGSWFKRTPQKESYHYLSIVIKESEKFPTSFYCYFMFKDVYLFRITHKTYDKSFVFVFQIINVGYR